MLRPGSLSTLPERALAPKSVLFKVAFRSGEALPVGNKFVIREIRDYGARSKNRLVERILGGRREKGDSRWITSSIFDIPASAHHYAE